jgi:hypothetical protein
MQLLDLRSGRASAEVKLTLGVVAWVEASEYATLERPPRFLRRTLGFPRMFHN